MANPANRTSENILKEGFLRHKHTSVALARVSCDCTIISLHGAMCTYDLKQLVPSTDNFHISDSNCILMHAADCAVGGIETDAG